MSYDVAGLQACVKDVLPLLWQDLEDAADKHANGKLSTADYERKVFLFGDATLIAFEAPENLARPQRLFEIGAEFFALIEKTILALSGDEKTAAQECYGALCRMYAENAVMNGQETLPDLKTLSPKVA